ncbi:MAG: hypothetical protein RMA76_41660 [Deltaproteobacteria bacterium]|jgi:hypothetical protein
MHRASLLAVVLLGASASAYAQTDQDFEFGSANDLVSLRPPFVSVDTLDPHGYSRFHLTTRGAFSDPVDVQRETVRWAFELSTALRLTDGLAIVAALPFGAYAPKPGVNEFFIGNFKLGLAGGFDVALPGDPRSRNRPHLTFGFGFDVYAPTAPEVPRAIGFALEAPTDPMHAIASIRSYDPELYVTRLMTFRPRFQAGVSVNVFTGLVELSLAPAFTAQRDAEFLMMFHWLVHLAVQPVSAIEPYLQLGNTIAVTGEAAGVDLTQPVQLTIGARGHFGPVSPALFLAIDLAEGLPIVGIDLAGILYRQERGVARGDDDLGF